jgi:hypothetical protein
MKTIRPDLALERLLLALERDLTDATDEEVLAAARELGMDPAMKGSAAFFGVTKLVQWPGNSSKRSRAKTARKRKDPRDELDR